MDISKIFHSYYQYYDYFFEKENHRQERIALENVVGKRICDIAEKIDIDFIDAVSGLSRLPKDVVDAIEKNGIQKDVFTFLVNSIPMKKLRISLWQRILFFIKKCFKFILNKIIYWRN
jgi:hypothetical protein